MKINAKITVEYNEVETAKIVFKSLNPDNGDYLDSNVQDNILSFNIESDNLGTFLNTADDLIFSEITIEDVLNSASSE
ncbi:KEOPS complex subunit Pcc1 [Methanobrevibacter filiformis]|uniref:Uncharacterized protein n=1 Tax=Methanobrevibacter filiformis TaxID=55758 RepID=A0A166ESM5_9EURY|nr:KEOPS complex subunit Pcc1 [Methanobrevibacter filiformis]KZX16964.1 hypothetical protein MBFIL_04370 [Methanobrevibacter filiformis]